MNSEKWKVKSEKWKMKSEKWMTEGIFHYSLFVFHLICPLPNSICQPADIKELEAVVQHDREQIEYFLGFGDT